MSIGLWPRKPETAVSKERDNL